MAQNDSVLLVYFSRAGENWNMKNGNEVGPIERGNTAVLSDLIVVETGAKVYEILPAVDYPYDYYQTVTQANQERDDDARPAIKYPMPYDLTHYRYIFIGSPVWCGQPPMIMRTFYETYSAQLAGKTIIPFGTHEGSGISSLVSNIKTYLPSDITVLKEYGIYGHNVCNEETAAAVRTWIQGLNIPKQMQKMDITIGGVTQAATLVDNSATQALVTCLQNNDVTVTLNSSGGFEIWGALGFSLPTSDEQITAQPGDIILYNGSNICLFYGSNSWSYTRLGYIDGLTESELRTFLHAGESNISVTLSIGSTTDIENTQHSNVSSQKVLRDGQVLLESNGKTYNLEGKQL